MGREPRLEAAGWYHITIQAVDGLDAFALDDDKRFVLQLFGVATRRFDWTCIAYCVMTTHYHFVVSVPDATLAQAMHFVNTVFAREYNAARGRRGHVFRARYGSRPVVTDGHLLEVCRYVDLNPVRAGVCPDPADWRWSSFRATAGLDPGPPFLDVQAALALFGRTLAAGREAYVRFVYDAIAEL